MLYDPLGLEGVYMETRQRSATDVVIIELTKLRTTRAHLRPDIGGEDCRFGEEEEVIRQIHVREQVIGLEVVVRHDIYS